MFPLSNYEATRTFVADRISDIHRAAGDATRPTRPAHRRPLVRRGHLSRLFR
jgi:hypothetical protein